MRRQRPRIRDAVGPHVHHQTQARATHHLAPSLRQQPTLLHRQRGALARGPAHEHIAHASRLQVFRLTLYHRQIQRTIRAERRVRRRHQTMQS